MEEEHFVDQECRFSSLAFEIPSSARRAQQRDPTACWHHQVRQKYSVPTAQGHDPRHTASVQSAQNTNQHQEARYHPRSECEICNGHQPTPRTNKHRVSELHCKHRNTTSAPRRRSRLHKQHEQQRNRACAVTFVLIGLLVVVVVLTCTLKTVVFAPAQCDLQLFRRMPDTSVNPPGRLHHPSPFLMTRSPALCMRTGPRTAKINVLNMDQTP